MGKLKHLASDKHLACLVFSRPAATGHRDALAGSS